MNIIIGIIKFALEIIFPKKKQNSRDLHLISARGRKRKKDKR